MRQFAIIALLSLAACGPTKQQITSQCELDALNQYPVLSVTGPLVSDILASFSNNK